MAYPDTVDMSEDYLVWNDTETVTYESRISESSVSSTSVSRTLWLTIRKDRLPSDSILHKMDLTVELPVATLGSVVPKMHDVMQRSDGTRWVVQLVELVATANEYRVHVIRSRRGAA